MENPDLPSPPNQRWEKARLYPSRGFILDWLGVGGGGGGDGGLLFHFILSKTVDSITSRCSGIRAVTGKIKDGTQGTAEIEPRTFLLHSQNSQQLRDRWRYLTCT